MFRVFHKIPAPLLALVAGGTAPLGFQPLGWWPCTVAGFAVLLHLLHRADRMRRAALIGWLFGVGLFSVGNNWIATAFTYQAAMPAWLGWVAVVLLAFYLAVYPMLAGLAAWRLSGGPREQAPGRGFGLVAILAASWTVCEWLRGWVFTGFAWNPVGMVTLGGYDAPGLAGIAPWLGTYALSGLVVILAGSCWLAMRGGEGRGAAGRGMVARATMVLVPILLFVVPWPAWHGGEGDLRFTLVQPDIRQDVLNDSAWFERNFRKTAALTTRLADRPSGDGPRLVLWPESGVPDYLRAGYPERYYRMTTFAADPRLARARIADVIGPDSMLLTGAVDLVIGPDERASAVRNVVTAIGPDARIRGSYAKAHLVPYGEYLPMRNVLEPIGLSRLVEGALDFEEGPGPRTLDLGAYGRAGIQICYEIIFPGAVVDRSDRPDYIVNPTNDGWFGAWGPPQHLAQARMRAIEEGLPVLRPTTTGISAVIDAGGTVRAHIPQFREGRIDAVVPPARAPTWFARAGNALSLGWALLFLLAGMVATRRPRV
ncbi:apolipoprotein N-acyltransferase [Croceicoccus hydrothermalis]|uniref:apolipoprotein N-acyltransferase n=1 Tax=Croceicoccus hydrothermalis TaxID=2867964 RepID=UPI001EFB9E29|nr:apolipoprotein N-acyltransferase [Croceicoccus hydrothermalis]